MLTYIARRFAVAIPTLLAISFIMFAILYRAGDPLQSLGDIRKLDRATYQSIIAENHLNEPLLGQYWYWLSDVFHGNLGRSFRPTGGPVWDELTRRLPKSLELLAK